MFQILNLFCEYTLHFLLMIRRLTELQWLREIRLMKSHYQRTDSVWYAYPLRIYSKQLPRITRAWLLYLLFHYINVFLMYQVLIVEPREPIKTVSLPDAKIISPNYTVRSKRPKLSTSTAYSCVPGHHTREIAVPRGFTRYILIHVT